MNERFSHELPKWMRWLGIWRINRDSIDFKWGYFAPQFGLQFVIQRGTYFSQNYAILFTLGWGTFKVTLPFKTSLPEGCDMPRYGFSIHHNTLWIYTGGEYDKDWGQVTKNGWISWDLPFFDKYWVKTETLVDPIMWRFENDKTNHTEEPYTVTLPYQYTLRSGEVQNVKATCIVRRMTHARKWLPFLKTVWQHIDIEFSDEVGEESGSWKGGCTGCSWTLLPNESVPEALFRMQQERKF